LTSAILIWDNASTDGTAEYLDTLDDPRLQIVHNAENIGQSAYARAFALTSASHLIEIDDDVVDAPVEWDRRLLEAFEAIPDMGFLTADLVDDELDQASFVRHHLRADLYSQVEVNGVALLEGPTGGGCAMTSRAVYDRVGGFQQRADAVFFLEDAAYSAEVERHGYRKAVLADLRVHHTGGPHYAGSTPAKDAFWERYWNDVRRKNRIKRILLAVPGIRALNKRIRLFGLPEWEPPPEARAQLTGIRQ
jgi:GT2 family glycosyltransferase